MSLRAPPPTQPTRTPSNRLVPPPSLFVAPPNAPNSSTDNKSTESLDSPTPPSSAHDLAAPSRSTTRTAPRLHGPAQAPPPTTTITTSDRQRQPSATAASWRALQSTLDEVEHNALSGASVFGTEHSRALEELRRAQVELARAWARSETDGGGGGDGGGTDTDGDGGAQDDGGAWQAGDTATAATTATAARSTVLASRKPGSRDGAKGAGGAGGGKSALEEETAADVGRARARRLANDRYFARVNEGVVDVVGRLEGVAQKMGGVEMESQEIWGGEGDDDDDDGAEDRSGAGSDDGGGVGAGG